MKEWNEHIDDLVAAQLAGEISASGKAELDQWIALDPDNARYVQAMARVFEASFMSDAYSDSRAQEAWESVRRRIDPGAGRMRQLGWLKYAAAASVVLAVGILLYINRTSPPEEVVLTAGSEIRKETLPGGTEVALNAGAEISYVNDSTSSERKVKLKGEAFFEVDAEDSGNLVVETDGLLIRDIGTSFNVKALAGKDTVWVYVREGAVSLEADAGDKLMIGSDQEGYFIRSSRKLGLSTIPDENSASYADLSFRFRNTPLRKAIRKLNEVYQDKFALGSDALSDCRITVSFNGEPIDVIAEVMAQSLGLTVTFQNGVYVLNGASCE